MADNKTARELLAAASPRPWAWRRGQLFDADGAPVPGTGVNDEVIVYAVNNLERLLDRVQDLESEIRATNEILAELAGEQPCADGCVCHANKIALMLGYWGEIIALSCEIMQRFDNPRPVDEVPGWPIERGLMLDMSHRWQEMVRALPAEHRPTSGRL